MSDPSTTKAVASTSKSSHAISSSSFIDLQAELHRARTSLSATPSSTILGKRPSSSSSSKSDIFSKKNRGLTSRLAKDAISRDFLEDKRDPVRAKAMLEKKARLYEKIRRGKTAGLSEEKLRELLVDFDERPGGEGSDEEYTSGSDDEDESRKVPERPVEDDPLVEYTDEFGRTRLIPRSEMPRGAPLPGSTASEEQDSKNIIYGDQHHFPVYTPDPEVLAARAAAFAAQEPLVKHYDATLENRTKAAGFYAFSGTEEEREEQMRALKREREETELARGKKEGGEMSERDKEKEERRRKLEEKREELKRRKEAKTGGAK